MPTETIYFFPNNIYYICIFTFQYIFLNTSTSKIQTKKIYIIKEGTNFVDYQLTP
jgi:hypothetical protein